MHVGLKRALPLVLAIAVGALACTTSDDGTPTAARTTRTPAAAEGVPTGLWGGDGIILRVTEAVTTVEFECAAGIIEDPLRVDEQGRFEAEGRYSTVGGGPVEVTPAPQRRPSRARYSGSTDGSTMTLTVVLMKTGDEVGRFELAYGHEPHLERCL